MLSAALCAMPPLAEGGKTLVEYVWLSAGSQLCSRTRVMDSAPQCLEDVPAISIDGSSCGTAQNGEEVFAKPRKLFHDPQRGAPHLLVLCDTFTVKQLQWKQHQAYSIQVPVLQPHPTNNRVACQDIMARCRSSDATFTAEQEFAVLPPSSSLPAFAPGSPAYACDSGMLRHASDASCTLPFPFSSGLSVSPQCESGKRQGQPQRAMTGRSVAERHLQCCLCAGIKVSDMSQRHAPPSPHSPGSHPVWSYQVGPLPGLEMADQLWMSRFLLLRVSEDEGARVSLNLGANGGLRRGLCCTFGYSTAASRRPGTGLSVVQQHAELLRAAHLQHTLAYSVGNTTSLCAGQFSLGGGGSDGAVVVPAVTLMQQAGQLLDRRPLSDADPYTVVAMLTSTTLQVPLQAVLHCHVLQAEALRQGTCGAPDHTRFPAPSQASHPSACGPDMHRCCDGDLDAWCAAGIDGTDDHYDDDGTASMNSEEVLIDELERMDGLGPDTSPQHYQGLGCLDGLAGYGPGCMLMEEGFDECCSDGCSPKLPPVAA